MIVTHISSVHKRYDTRIFLKQCKSLASASYKVHLLVADGKGDETDAYPKIRDVGKPSGRLYRIFVSTFKLYRAALKTKAVLIHFHDPELLFAAFILCVFHRKKVIYDIHENYTKTIKKRSWLGGKLIAYPLAFLFGILEALLARTFSANVIVLDDWAAKYKRTTVVKNYPQLPDTILPAEQKQNEFVYIGSLAPIRGIIETLKIFRKFAEKENYLFHIVGTFTDTQTENKAKKYFNDRIIYHGYMPYHEAQDLIKKAKFGFCLYTDKKFEENIPVKMYEYLSYNTPVICSDFKSWKHKAKSEGWAIALNPYETEQAAEKILNAARSDDYQKLYNSCSKHKVKYSWANEEQKLLDIYKHLLSEN